jgi:peptidoglycan/LPS O-acetylase OafA/YrhL
MNRSTSLYLDIVRPLAALVVLASHVSFDNLSDHQLGFMDGTGVQAVDAFFVLSGFVIAHVCSAGRPDARSYFVSRAARIYSVAVCAIVLTFVLDTIGTNLDPAAYSGPYQPLGPGLFFRSLFFIGEQWNAHRFPGSDGAFWSLGFEVWYYVAFGAFLFAPKWCRWLAPLAVLAFIGPKVAVMFPAWLMGVASYHLCRRQCLPKAAGWCAFGLSFVLLAAYQFAPHSALQPFMPFSLTAPRLFSTAEDYFLTLVFSMNLVGFAAISDSFAGWLEPYARTIRWIAGGTFAIYLAHLPVMHLLAAVSPWPKSSPWTLALLLIATPVVCMAFAEVSERRKEVWRRLFVSLADAPAAAAAGARVFLAPAPAWRADDLRHPSAQRIA